MRNAIPIRWIEQAEARQALTAALFERAPEASRCGRIEAAAAQLVPQLRSWLAERHLMGWLVAQARHGVVRQPACRPERGGDGYCCIW